MDKKKIVLGVMAALVVVAGGAALIIKVNADTVAVSATVATTVTCSASATSTSFGTLTTSAVGTATPNVTASLACNSGAGCTLQVLDLGHGSAGMYNASSSHLIPSANATLVAGTEGYGIQGATGTPATGGALTINSVYAVTGNQVGGLSTTALTLASSSAPTTGGTVVVTHKAAISNLTAAGSYADTVTYQCIGN